VFLLWKKRRIDDDSRRVWRCYHGGRDRFVLRPVIVESFRSQRGPSRRYVWSIGPTIRTCCSANPDEREAWWANVAARIRDLDAAVLDEGDRTAIRSRLAAFIEELEKVVPRGHSGARADDHRHGPRPQAGGEASPQVPPCFATLGLTPPVTKVDVMTAYRRKAFETHPDRGGSQAEFVAIGLAKELALRLAT
jgi:hypothetical protein